MNQRTLRNELIQLSAEAHITYEIENVLTDMIDTIDICHLNYQKIQNQKDQQMIQRLHDDYQHNLQTLQQEKIDLDDKIQKIHQDAVVTRDLFVSDIAQVLSESRNAKTLRMKVKDLQRKLHLAESYEADLKEMKRRVKELESSRGASVEDLSPSSPRDSINPAPALGAAAAVSSLRKRPVKKFLFHLEDKLLLEIFAFLETQDVLRAAQVCRFVFKRVDTLFGIESQIAKAEWAIEPSELQQQEPSSAVIAQGTAVSSVIAPAAPQAAASAPAPPLVGLTKSMADALLKKLSPSELKTIIAINDQQKSSLQKIEHLSSENEDLKSRLQNTESVRDFLISKLKEAEVALKSSLTDNSVIKRQAENDHEAPPSHLSPSSLPPAGDLLFGQQDTGA